jgi:hypothetical protein
MVVLHEGESAGQHGVLEGMGRVEACYLRGEALAYTQVPGAPGDAVTRTQQAGSLAAERYRCFPEVRVAQRVDFDGTREIEDASDRRVNEGEGIQFGHD